MKQLNSIIRFFNQREFLLYFILFALALSLFTYLHLDPTFADPDSFYHVKITQILRDEGIITQLPWLSATTLKYNFIDHHFLYHLVLIPFISFFPPLIGLKIATIILASLTILVMFWFLKQLKVKGAFWYALFLLTINPFIFRLGLAKAQALVLIMLFLIIYFLFHRRYLGLLLTSCLYVWLYAGWPLLFIITGLYLAISYFKNFLDPGILFIKRAKTKIRKQNLITLLSVTLGVLAGLFFSPYFAKNFYFYWQQSFKIAMVNYQSVISVGAEWYPYPLPDLLLAATPFFLLLLFALTTFIYSAKKQSNNSWFFLILTALFFLLTLKSRRYVEYLIPIAVCFCAIAITNFSSTKNPAKKYLAKLKIKQVFIFSPLILFIIFSPIFYRDLTSIKKDYQSGFSFSKFSTPSAWLKENSPKNSIVFHSDWDESPILFYHNDHNYYLVGLDPTFMYEYDKDLHQRWVDITLGNEVQELHSTIKNLFNADYVFVDINQNASFNRNLANNFNFEQVFENSEAKIYKVAD